MSDRSVDVPDGPVSKQAIYTIFCLILAYMMAFADRTILSLMIDPIRAEFSLSDTEASLLAGMAFVVFYVALGFPMGRIADTGNRRGLLVGGLVAWSLATGLCGMARSVTQLFVARICVGIGEATLTPVAYTMIGDLVPRARLGLAMSIYALGATVGGGVALIAGGMVVQWALTAPPIVLPLLGTISGWRTAFLMACIPGLLLAVLILLTVREPVRRSRNETRKAQTTLRDLGRHMSQHAWAFTAVLLGYSLIVLSVYAFVIWSPAYLSRIHHLPPAEVGLWIGLILSIGASIGSVGGGLVSDYLTRRGRDDAPALMIVASQALHLPFLIFGYLTTDATSAVVSLFIGMTIISTISGVQHATIQAMTPSQLRGQIAALYLMMVNLIGLGLGPTIVGILNDQVFGGPQGIGMSLALVSGCMAPPAALMLALALKPIRKAILETEAAEAEARLQPAAA